jgi:hypothetical protein
MSWQIALSDYLIVAPHLLLGGVIVLFCRKRLYTQFPLFFAYTIAEMLQFAVLFPMLRIRSVTGWQYTFAYWIGMSVSAALRFGVIHEIFSHVFHNYRSISSYGRPAFRWLTVGLVGVTLLLAMYTGVNGLDRLASVVYLLDRAASITQCVLLVALFFLASFLGLSLRSHVFGIALGLGVFASVELVTAAIRSQVGYAGSTAVNFLLMATYHVCVLLWLFYLWAPERSPQYAVKALPEHDLEDWNKELQRLIQQ